MIVIEALEYQGYPLTSKFYNGIIGLAVKLANKYGKVSLINDFKQIALATACRMEPKFTPEFGASFYTFINKPIKNEIQRTFGNPNRHTKHYKQIQKFIEEFNKDTGRYPEISEITTGTSLTRFTILSVYYDKYIEVSMSDINIDHEELLDPFNYQSDKIMEYLDILSDNEKVIINSIFIDELPSSEIAKLLGTSIKNVEEMTRIALEKLKESIL
jgi:RNA polymerase sigma factor (sigma-70 family)